MQSIQMHTILSAGEKAAGFTVGLVFAVFERSFYARDTAGRLVCAGGPEIGNGPLNIVYATRPPLPDPGAKVAFDLTGVSIWRPDPWPAYNKAACRAALAQIPRAKGLLAAPGDDPFKRAAQAPLAALAAWRDGPAPVILKDLLGLGVGLTPAGDDALGGAALALQAARRIDQATALRDFLEREVPTATNAISAAHLLAAANGTGAAAFHKIVAALLEGTLPDLAPLDAIGHSSGWDALAGALAVLG
jgi:hypothetical protein